MIRLAPVKARLTVVAGILTVALFGACVGEAAAERGSVAEFYRGKTVTVVVGSSPGGGYDLYARMLARHIGRYIPGTPTVIVQNMPGAGSIVAANYLYNVAPRDGSVFGTFVNVVLHNELIGTIGVQFRAADYSWVGSMSADTTICLARLDARIKAFQDLFTTPLRVGGSGPGTFYDAVPKLLNGLVGTKFDLITGYTGTSEIYLAIERGEVQGLCGIFWSSAIGTKPEWFAKGQPQVTILFQTGQRRHPDLADVPLLRELVSDPRALRVLDTFFTPLAISRPFVAPPRVPEDRLSALRQAFVAAIDDPTLRQEAKQAGLALTDPLDGEQAQKLVQAFSRASPEDVAEIAKYLR